MAFVAAGISCGIGRHEQFLNQQQGILIVKYILLETIGVVFSTCFAKVSVCIFILRLLKDAVATKRRLFIYSCAGLLSISSIADFLCTLLSCRPTARIWNPEISGSCWAVKVQKDVALVQGGMLSSPGALNHA